jgi:hypothetical protein
MGLASVFFAASRFGRFGVKMPGSSRDYGEQFDKQAEAPAINPNQADGKPEQAEFETGFTGLTG